jgi:hypothetical protein
VSAKKLASLSQQIHGARHAGKPWEGRIGGAPVSVEVDEKHREFSVWVQKRANGGASFSETTIIGIIETISQFSSLMSN